MNIDLAKCFSALGNETRLRCLHLVAVNGEACVCEIVQALAITQPSASKALNSLKSVGLLNVRREANWNYFSLNKGMSESAKSIITAAVKELASSSTHSADQKRFVRLDLRENKTQCR